MSKARLSPRSLPALAVLASILVAGGCGEKDAGSGGPTTGGSGVDAAGRGGSGGTGGMSSGGTGATGGSALGGVATGGAAIGGSATGGAATGGFAIGGSAIGGFAVGGSATGGFAMGGSALGGTATGGSALGGSATGGRALGGSATGGTAIGGRATGGSATGGTAIGGSATGGSATGGTATGGTAIGGRATGGSATGGTAIGGSAVGGRATGGSATGGSGSIRDRFPPTRPATITVTGTIMKNDVVCVIVGTSGGCLAQNSPPCNPSGGQATVTLDLTIDAQDNITVEAPYQDMCAPDYFCAVSGPGCPIPTSYPVPLVDQRYLYDPRSTDRCRRDSSGTAIQVEHLVNVSTNGNVSLTIHQVCRTRMRNDGTSPTSFVNDTRDWTTVVTF